MYKPPGNPIAIELTRTHRKRTINLGCIKPIRIELPNHTSIKKCAWCAEKEVKGRFKYCSTNCGDSAMAWAYPQKENALWFLLLKQEWKCKICNHQYPVQSGSSHWHLMVKLKSNSPKERRPEVDHIIPISKGGISIGLDNHQVICYTCHKVKTKVDNSGPRKK